MALYRNVSVKFWSDTFVSNLTPEQKYFFLYLLTNEKTKQCGIYETTVRNIAFDTGYNHETVNKLLDFFIKSEKIMFDSETSELAVANWPNYNVTTSPKVRTCINSELKKVKNKKLIYLLYDKKSDWIDWPFLEDYTLSQQEQEREEEQEQEREQEQEARVRGELPTSESYLKEKERRMERRSKLLPVSKAVAALFGKTYPNNPADCNPNFGTLYQDIEQAAEKIQAGYGGDAIKQLAAYAEYCDVSKRKRIGTVWKLPEIVLSSDWLVLLGRKPGPSIEPRTTKTTEMVLADREIATGIAPEFFLRDFGKYLKDSDFRENCKEYLIKNNLWD